MTLAIPARRTAASNGNSCSSRSSRSPMWAGAWFSPPSASPWPTMCLRGGDDAVGEVGALERLDVGAAELGGEVRVLAVGLLDAAPARIAGDVEDRGERVAGAGQQHPPADRGGHRRDDVGVEARRRADGLLEARRGPGDQAVQALLVDDRRDARAASPRRGSAGSRSRSAATSIGRRFVEPARRVIWPMPSAASAASRASSSPVSGTTSKAQNEPSWATFSARVMRASRSATRASIGEGGVAVAGLGGRHQPFTAPAVRPPTMWRSAMT